MADNTHVSPWSVDPVSWLTTATVPITATLLATLYGVLEILVVPPRGGVLQWIALICLAAAGVVVHLRTRPPRGILGAPAVLVVLALVSAAAVLSTLDYDGTMFSLTLWWVPLGISLILIALAPYVRASTIVAITVAQVLIVGLIAFVLVVPDDPRWPAVTTAIVVVTPIIAGGIVSAVLSASIVRISMRWSGRSKSLLPSLGAPTIDDHHLVRAVDDDISEQLVAAVTFLRDVAHRGEIREGDADRARALSLDLRARLLADASATWLERIVRGHPIELQDPDRLADQLTVAQRTALRAMIDALVSDPESGFVSARVTLRSIGAGTVAVALRITTTLPEGRRISFLAPYYVALSAAVRDIRWHDGASLKVEFEAPIDMTTGSAPTIQRTPRRLSSQGDESQRPE
ncbi:hypothetical protein [Microcella sp.]|uniref:hypothetical protein n=1 Tax=Microcella sp. TaxID=1913979 RepID=UPI00391DC092